MKKTVLLAIILAASSAYASKARVGALLGANHLVDAQTTFVNPSHVGELNPFLTFEMGAAGTAAEGGLLKKLKNGNKILVYLGHKNTSELTSIILDQRATFGYIGQQNPVEVIYAFDNAGFGASLSNYENKNNGTKETTAVLKYGQTQGDFSWYSHLTAMSHAEKNTATNADKLDVGPRVLLGGSKNDGEYRYFGNFIYGQGKNALAAGSSTVKDMLLNVGYEDRSLKNEASDIYYGLMFNYAQRDIEGKKITAYNLPAFIGLEHTVTSWATFRGSVAQNILIGQNKDETATNTDPAGIDNNTQVAGGLGLKYGKLTLDGMLSAAANGQVNGTSFLTQASVTYNF